MLFRTGDRASDNSPEKSVKLGGGLGLEGGNRANDDRSVICGRRPVTQQIGKKKCENFFIEPEFRGHGWGRKMLDALLKKRTRRNVAGPRESKAIGI